MTAKPGYKKSSMTDLKVIRSANEVMREPHYPEIAPPRTPLLTC
jgi:hypothetical protein